MRRIPRILRAAAALSLGLAWVPTAAPPAAAAEPRIEALAGGVAEALADGELSAVAVVDFTDLRGEPTELGRYLAEELSAALVQALRREAGKPAGPRVIDRVHLGRILAELELSATGLLDPEEVRRVGEIAGVDGLVTGSLVSFADTVRVNLKVLAVRTGQILFADDADLPRTRTLEDLEDRPVTVVVPCGGKAPGDLTLDGPPHRTVTLREVEIALQGCARVESAVHCLFTVIDLGGDGSFYVFGGTRAVLPKGTSVPVRRVHLGGESASGTLSRVGAALVRGVPTPGSAVFEGIPPGTELLRRLELHLHGEDAHFPEVPIRRP